MLWLLPISLIAIGTGAILRVALRRGRSQKSLTTDPVSSDWLAQARARDEHQF